MQNLDPHPKRASSPRPIRDRAAFASFGVVTMTATALVALAATHPAQAASMLANVTSAVTCATTTACVTGANTSNGPGVKGSSQSSYGVQGISISNDGLKGMSTSSNGLSASSTSAFGVKATSSKSDGVYGTTASVYGPSGKNALAGVVGTTTSEPYGFGVIGSAPGVGGGGVVGLAPSASSTAVGVYGNAQVIGANYGSATGVEGQTGSGIGVVGTGIAGTGVEGESYSGSGIVGSSTNGSAISGTSTNAAGVFGVTSSFGDSPGTSAVVGISNGSAPGLFASSEHGDAVDAESFNGIGAQFLGGTYGVIGRSDTTPLAAADENGNVRFYVDGSGDIYYDGSLNAVSSAARGSKVRTFGAKSAAPTVEDSGSAQLISGTATVRLDATFASSIDPHAAYRVFLTPDGDTRGLYVAAKTPAGFIVHETQGGRSSLAFDYRIIATSLGAVGQRMSVASPSLLPGADRAMLAKLQTRPALAELKVPLSRAALERTPFSRR